MTGSGCQGYRVALVIEKFGVRRGDFPMELYICYGSEVDESSDDDDNSEEEFDEREEEDEETPNKDLIQLLRTAFPESKRVGLAISFGISNKQARGDVARGKGFLGSGREGLLKPSGG